MKAKLIIDSTNRRSAILTRSRVLMWKAWRESRVRFFSALALLVMLVIYAVFTGPGYLSRHNTHFPDKPLIYSVYIWSGLFHYALQGSWTLAAFVLALGGLARERATGVALFTFGLPVKRSHIFLIRAATAWVEAIVLGMTAALLIPTLSVFVGESYPPVQAAVFGACMSMAGLVILSVGFLLSELFEGEFSAPVVGLCGLAGIFFGYKAHAIPGLNVFDVMSAATSIDPTSQLLTRVPWSGLATCMFVSLCLLVSARAVIRARDV